MITLTLDRCVNLPLFNLLEDQFLQNVKPQLQSKTSQQIANIIGKTPKVIKVQKRNYAAFTPRKPDNEPPLWLLAIMGTFASSYSLKKKN